MWFRKEDEFLWIDVMSEGKIHNVVNKMIDILKRDDISEYLKSDEQEKMKNVNTNNQELKVYKSEGRILEQQVLLN